MKRIERLRAAADFAAVRAHGRAVHCATLTLSWIGTTHAQSRYGFVVGKRVGNAVTRNLVKRRLRAIMDTQRARIPGSHDIVVSAHPSAAHSTFVAMERDVAHLLRRARLTPPTVPATSRQDEGAVPITPTSTHLAE